MVFRKRSGRVPHGGRSKASRRLCCRVKGDGRDETQSRVQALHSGYGEVLLHPVPQAVESCVPSLKSWITVPLTNHNSLPARINGHLCDMYVDCGTTSAMIAHRVADKLGLLDKVSFAKNYELQLWTTKVRHTLKVVENVEVRLAGGVALRCTFLVLPQNMVSTLPGILLDNATLRHAGAVQEFSEFACMLYFPSRKPKWAAKKGGDSQYVVDVNLRRSTLRSKKMNIHVDTGATSFYVSPRCLHTQLCLPRVPRCVTLVLAEGVAVTSGFVRVAGTDTFDFVVGKEMLSRYRCVLDFASSHLYFHVEERVFRLKLRKSRTV
uniref:Peptidase A2 domain-containing protein n=1 Tax=Scylla olivacea TaxID=85551 RepID=A0A0P4VZU6_SCYOL